uniref:Protein kinase domain-containing protein n=1 Tax=Glossina brevipalpis TaxID=37001 RepID=A0A1A9W2X1_9MUSC
MKYFQTPDISEYISSSVNVIDCKSEVNDEEDLLKNILPSEIEHLPYQGKDVLKRLLDLKPEKRLRSVRALQRIAMYKNFKINPDFVLNINPLDIIAKDNIMIFADNQIEESALAEEAFRNF